MGRLSTSLFVIVLSLSAVGFVPSVDQVQAASTMDIYIPVISSGLPVTDATVNLTDVHTGSVVAAPYSVARSAYVVSSAPAGYYRVDVTHDDYYDASATPFRFDGTANYTVSPTELSVFPYKEWEWNVSVRTPGGQKIVGATVGFYDSVLDEFVEKGVTNAAGGWVVLNMWTIGSIDLVVIARGYETYIGTVSVSGDSNPTVTMTVSQKVASFVTDSSGSPAPNVVAYLVNTDDSIPLVKRVLRSTSSAMSFDAYTGDFVLVVDAYGCAAHVQAVTVPGSLPPASIQLPDQTQRTENVGIDYGPDFRSFTLSVYTTWSYDNAYPGLRYNDIGSLRMQVDLVRGNGDGVLDVGEVNLFLAEVSGYGSQYVSSEALLTVNDTSYISALSTTGFALTLGPGSVLNTSGVVYTYVCDYTANSLDLEAPDYTALAYARPDTPAVDYRYQIELVNGYELVQNHSSDNVKVTGYTVVVIDHVSGSSTEAIAMEFETSYAPSPRAEVIEDESTDSVYLYVITDDGGNVTGYVVRVNRNATFSAGDSTDPNGNPLSYTWDFGDGHGPFTTAKDTYVYRYSTAAVLRLVTLSVTDVAALTNSTTINVTCDGLEPAPVISVKNQTVNETDNSITINQRDAVVFNATYSTDDVAAIGDEEGTIDFFEFDYGDGNKSGRIPWEPADKNVTHAYASSGEFTVVLNVTDVVGHWRNTTLLVEVCDITPPTPVAVITPNPAMVGQVVWFDAANSTDSDGAIVSYVWTFIDNGELVTLSGEKVSYVFMTGPQTVAVTLNCTDSDGNWATVGELLYVSGVIPELPNVLIPILGSMCMVVLLSAARRKVKMLLTLRKQ